MQVRGAAEAPAVAHHPTRAVGLVVSVCLPLCAPLGDQALAAELEALRALPRHRLCLRGPLALEALLGLAKPGAPATTGGEVLGELVAASLAVELVLGSVDAAGLGEDLGGDLLVASGGVVRRRGFELGPVDRQHRHFDKAGVGAEAEHLAEEVGERLLVAGAKAGDRRVVGDLLDRPRAEVTDAVSTLVGVLNRVPAPPSVDLDVRRGGLGVAKRVNLEGMASRCTDCVPAGTATLEDWTLTFRGVADIERLQGRRTYGAVWGVSDLDLERLDTYEGYPRVYRRRLVTVRVGNRDVGALTYVMEDDYVGLPSSFYYETIRRGYEQWDLPILALEVAAARAQDSLHDRGFRRFEPKGPKRLRAVGS